jgi:hypothetical protein
MDIVPDDHGPPMSAERRGYAVWWLNLSEKWEVGEPLPWMEPSAIYPNYWLAYGEVRRREAKGETWQSYPNAPCCQK